MNKLNLFVGLIMFAAMVLSFGWANGREFVWYQTNGPYGGNIEAFAIDSSGIIFVGTSNGGAGTSDRGVFYSTDNGDTWASCNQNLSNLSIRTLAIEPGRYIFSGTAGTGVFRAPINSRIWTRIDTGLTDYNIYALTADSSGYVLAGSLNGWLFRSADQGAHWTQIPKNLNSSVNALAKDSSRYVFAGTSGNGIFCSTDSGVTWDSCNIGLTTRFVYALAVNDGGQVFTGTNKGVFRSNNHGGNWNPYGLTDTIVTSLAVSPNGDLFAGTNNSGVYRRSGPGWVPCNNGSIDQRITALAIQSNGELYSGTRFGIFRSTNGSCDWTRVGLKITHVISLAVTPNEHIFAGVLGSGVYRTTDLGNNWTLTGGDGNCNALIAYNSSGIISAATYNGILHSTNDGGNWASFGLSGKIVQALAKNPSGLVYAGTRDSGVFVDSAGTGNWKPVGLKKNWINAIAIDLTGFIYAGTRDSGVFRSRGDGIWSQTGLTTTDVRSIAVNDSRRVFAGLSSGHVFWSADSGGNWTPKALSVDTVKAMTINSEGAVFAGTSTGVFRSADSGLTWVAYNPDLTTANVNALALTPKQYLVAGTYGGGVFRSEPSTPVEEGHGPIPRSFVLLQNFPNPFNPSTTIRYSLPRRDRISLVVFNMLGQQVRVLSEEEQTAGPHSVVWDGKDSKGRSLSSGLYFYRLTSESYSETKKMLLMK